MDEIYAMLATNSLLNKHQERRIEVTLYLVEQGLDEIAAYLHGGLPRGEMYETNSDLSIEECSAIIARIEEAKQIIARIKDHFGLEPRVNEVRGILMGYLSSLWESLHNARPRNLKGFGPVAPELYDALDPELMRLVNLVNDMLAQVSRTRRERG